jgi:hypothetical protein
MTPAAVSRPLVVAIEASISGGARPVVTGTTNLPDGTHLWIALNKPLLPDGEERLAAGLAACEDDCLPRAADGKRLSDDVVVKNGRFSDGPFTDKGAALSAGTYILDVYQLIGLGNIGIPANVLTIIGENGENLTGPLVNACCVGVHFGMGKKREEKAREQDRRSRDEAARDGSPYTFILYQRYVKVPVQSAGTGTDDAASAAVRGKLAAGEGKPFVPRNKDGDAPARRSTEPEAGSKSVTAETAALTQAEIDSLRAQLMGCWNPPVGVAEAKSLAIVVHFALNRDGLISGEPTIVNHSDDARFQTVAASAMRALQHCQPFRLPASKYEAWRDVEVKFDPIDMFRDLGLTGPLAGPPPPPYITRTLSLNEARRCANVRDATNRTIRGFDVITGMFATAVGCPFTPIYTRPDGTFGTGTAEEIAEEKARYERFRLKREAEEAAERRRRDAEEQAAAAERRAQKLGAERKRGYERISFETFHLDGKALAANEAKVSIQGYYQKIGQIETLSPSNLDTRNPTTWNQLNIGLLTDDAPRNIRKRFLDCRTTTQFGCQIVIGGRITMCTTTTLVGSKISPCLIVEDGWD